MNDEETLLKKRLAELAARSEARGIYTSSDFLTIYEQDVLRSLAPGTPFMLCGGYEQAERRLALFGSEDICGYEPVPPLALLKADVTNGGFAPEPGHRDYLGALMGLGIKREVIGDIIVTPGRAYIVCEDEIAGFITDELHEAGRSGLCVSRADELPQDCLPKSEQREFVIASDRLDAIVSAVFSLSRGGAKELIESGKVFINGRQTQKIPAGIKDGDTVSVRGMGRFTYLGVKLETKKGRLRVICSVPAPADKK